MNATRIIACTFALAALGERAGAQSTPDSQPPKRPVLEQQLRQRVAEVMRRRLQLNDGQMSQLAGVNSRYAPQLGTLATQERETRQRLRALLPAASPDQNEVGRLLDSLLQLQRQRVTLLESEQKELAVFLTPVQRAKYMGLQAQLKRRAEQLRRRGRGRADERAGNMLPR